MKNNTDVIIVGAGPAGAVLGYELASKGIDVLILERERLPRYKACGGTVTPKSADLLGCDISPVVQAVIDRAKVTYKLGKGFEKVYKHGPIGHMVMRDEFDQFLVSRAREVGANVAEGQHVQSVHRADLGVEVSTEKESFNAKIVVGADGANSVVVGVLGNEFEREVGIAMEAEVSVSPKDLAKWEGTAGIDLGYVRGGYGWVFPKQNHLSVGVGSPMQHAKALPSYHQSLLRWLNLDRYKVIKLKSHLLPVCVPGSALHKGRVLLLGDAAGLVDPLSGEGIYNAIKSAQLAAPVIAAQLAAREVNLQGYQQAVEKEILSEMKIARRGQRLFSRFPHVGFVALRRSDRVWRGACGVASGRATYSDLRRHLGPLRFLL